MRRGVAFRKKFDGFSKVRRGVAGWSESVWEKAQGVEVSRGGLLAGARLPLNPGNCFSFQGIGSLQGRGSNAPEEACSVDSLEQSQSHNLP